LLDVYLGDGAASERVFETDNIFSLIDPSRSEGYRPYDCGRKPIFRTGQHEELMSVVRELTEPSTIMDETTHEGLVHVRCRMVMVIEPSVVMFWLRRVEAKWSAIPVWITFIGDSTQPRLFLVHHTLPTWP
jgi:hypothetical protein